MISSVSAVRSHRVLAASLAVLLASSICPAQDSEEQASSDVEPLTYYETATVRARPITKATAAVSILDRETIDSLFVSSAAELLRFVPGVSINSSGPRAGTAYAQIRGGDPNFTVVLLDGVPLNDPTDPVGGAVNLHSLPASQVERIEVVRGPLSSFFGSTGLAGAIHIITRQGATAEPVYSFEAAGGNASTRQAAASLGQDDGKRSYFLGALWNEEQERVADERFEQLDLNGNVGFDFASTANLRLNGRFSSWQADDYPEASGGPVHGSGETRTSDHNEFNLGADWQWGPTARPHRLLLTGYRHELDRESPGVGFTVPPSVEQTVYNDWQLGWTYPALQFGSGRLSVGVELEHERGENASQFVLPDKFGGPIDGSYELDRSSGGVFAELLVERGRMLFELGARVDVPEGFDTALSPRAGMTYRLADERTRLRASAGRGFKLPSFFALASPPALAGNPELDPEKTFGIDAGLEHVFLPNRLEGSLVIFYDRFEDLIDFVFDEDPQPGDPPGQHLNRSNVRSYGAELAAGWSPHDRLHFNASLTRQEVEDLQSAEPLRHRPEWVGGGFMTWRLAQSLRWEVDAQSVSQSHDQQIPVPERRTTAGYTLYGSSLLYRFAPHWQLRGRVDNLADKQYETLIGFPGPERGFRVGFSYSSD